MGLIFIFDANVCLDIIHSLVNSSKIYFGYNNYQSLNRKLSEFFPPSYENITLKLHQTRVVLVSKDKQLWCKLTPIIWDQWQSLIGILEEAKYVNIYNNIALSLQNQLTGVVGSFDVILS